MATTGTIKHTKDPSRTISLRAKFVRDMDRRWDALKRDIATSIVKNDCFGIADMVADDKAEAAGALVAADALGSGAIADKFVFTRTDKKVDAFMKWLAAEQDKGVLEIITRPGSRLGAQHPWTNMYIHTAHQKGIQQARQTVRRELSRAGFKDLVLPMELERGGIQAVMNGPVHADRLAATYMRTYEDLKTVTSVTNGRVRRELIDGLTTGLTQGIADGKHPSVIARDLMKNVNGRVDAIGKVRARMIARTEVISAHNKAQVGEYINANREILDAGMQEHVEIKVDILVGGGPCPSGVCPEMGAGGPYTTAQADALVPAHPNCACSSAPRVVFKKPLPEGVHKVKVPAKGGGLQQITSAPRPRADLWKAKTPSAPHATGVDRWIDDGWGALGADEKVSAVRHMLTEIKHSKFGPADAEVVLGKPNILSGLKTRYRKKLGTKPATKIEPTIKTKPKVKSKTTPKPKPEKAPTKPKKPKDYISDEWAALSPEEQLKSVQHMLSKVHHKQYGPWDAEIVVTKPDVVKDLIKMYKKQKASGKKLPTVEPKPKAKPKPEPKTKPKPEPKTKQPKADTAKPKTKATGEQLERQRINTLDDFQREADEIGLGNVQASQDEIIERMSSRYGLSKQEASKIYDAVTDYQSSFTATERMREYSQAPKSVMKSAKELKKWGKSKGYRAEDADMWLALQKWSEVGPTAGKNTRLYRGLTWESKAERLKFESQFRKGDTFKFKQVSSTTSSVDEQTVNYFASGGEAGGTIIEIEGAGNIATAMPFSQPYIAEMEHLIMAGAQMDVVSVSAGSTADDITRIVLRHRTKKIPKTKTIKRGKVKTKKPTRRAINTEAGFEQEARAIGVLDEFDVSYDELLKRIADRYGVSNADAKMILDSSRRYVTDIKGVKPMRQYSMAPKSVSKDINKLREWGKAKGYKVEDADKWFGLNRWTEVGPTASTDTKLYRGYSWYTESQKKAFENMFKKGDSFSFKQIASVSSDEGVGVRFASAGSEAGTVIEIQGAGRTVTAMPWEKSYLDELEYLINAGTKLEVVSVEIATGQGDATSIVLRAIN